MITKELVLQWLSEKTLQDTASIHIYIAQRAAAHAVAQRDAELMEESKNLSDSQLKNLVIRTQAQEIERLKLYENLAAEYGLSAFSDVADAIAAARLQGAEEANKTIVRLIDTIKYMVGIAEKGTGTKCLDDETPERFLLAYVKHLESEVQRLDKGWHSANVMALDKSLQGERVNQQLLTALKTIATCQSKLPGDVVDIAQKAITAAAKEQT